MLIDLTEVSELTADVCVVGAGLAGITFARECLSAGFSVLLLEGGQWERDAAEQDLAVGDLDAPHYTPDAIPAGRRRQFGGTANDWTHVTRPGSGRVYARSLAGEALDFERKTWQPQSGWPIGLDDLAPWYDRAQRTWTGDALDGRTEQALAARAPLALRPGPLTTRMAAYGPADVFTLAFRDELLAADDVHVLVGSTVTELEFDATGAEVRAALVARADGSRVRVRAGTFVLAGGGLENVQLLLGSSGTAPGAAGNRHDNVGRFLTDHPEFRMGSIVPADPGLLDRIGLYDMHWSGSAMVSGLLTLSQELKREAELLNVGAVLIPQPAAFGSDAERALRLLHSSPASRAGAGAALKLLRDPRGAAAVLRMREQKRRGDFDYPDGFVWHRGGWSRPGYDRTRFGVLEVHAATEQTPHRENRVHLSDSRDRLGRRRLAVRLHWSERDHANVSRSMDLFAREIEGSGIGRFERWVDFTGPLRPVTTGLHHPMGGTRMAEDPREGVVDENGRVHGTRNLFVAGSSVFSTGLGYSNPTLTILALTLRLADHVKERAGVASLGSSAR